MSQQIAIRMSDDLAASIEQLIDDGRFPNKAEVVRAALEEFIERERRLMVGRAIADGYRRTPQGDDEVAATTEAAVRSIDEEPW